MMNRCCFALLLGLAACGGSVSIDPQGKNPEPGGSTQGPTSAPSGTPPPSPSPPSTSVCDLAARTYATGEGIPSGLAVDDRYVYWLTDAGASADGGTKLRAADKCGQASPVTLATAPYFASGLSVDAHGVYFTTTRGDGVGSVAFLPKEVPGDGGPWAFGKLASWDGAFRPGDVKAGAGGVITWVEPEAGVVAWIGKANVRVELATRLDHPTHLAFDGQSMYVGTQSGLVRLGTTGAPAQVTPEEVRGLTSDAVTGVVFALTRTTAYRIDNGQKPSVLLVSFPDDIDDIAANSANLFFVDGPIASVSAFPVHGGPVSSSIATAGKGPGRIAADDLSVYWTAGGVIARTPSTH